MSANSNQPKKNPLVDVDAVDFVFSALENMEMDLDEDPLLFGPKRLNLKIAQAQKMRMACSRFEVRISCHLQTLSRAYRISKLEFDLKKQKLFAEDIEVKSGRNLAAQDAIANMKLVDVYRELFYLEDAVTEYNDLMKVVRMKMRVVCDVQSRLKEQQRMCERELDIGGHWGSRKPKGSTLNDIRYRAALTNVSQDVDDMIDGVEQQAGKAAPPEPKQFLSPLITGSLNQNHPPIPEKVVVDDNIEQFLDGFAPESDEGPEEEDPALDLGDLLS